MKKYGGVHEAHIFLTLALVGDQWSASRPGPFSPMERTPGNHWIGGWAGHGAGLNDEKKIMYPTPRRVLSQHNVQNSDK
jgi:hypothetical protein